MGGHLRIVSFLVCLLLSVAPAYAGPDSSGLEREVTFSIAPQPLDEALLELSKQANLQLMLAAKAVGPRRSAGLSGRFTVHTALNSLLKGTGLTFTAVGNTVTIEPAGSAETVRARDDVGLRLAQGETVGSEEVVIDAAKTDAELVVKGVKDTGVINQGVIPRQLNQALRYEIVDRAEIARSGATSISDLFRDLSSNARPGTDTQTFLAAQLALASGAVAVNDTVDLRGLGAAQTLVMVNGRRLFGGDGEGADIGRIPIEAIERIEILPTSGSAIYGANAVGGVINVVLRKDYSGTELSAYYGTADGAAPESRLTLHHGQRFNDGSTNLSVMAEVHAIDPLTLAERSYQERILAHVTPQSPRYFLEIGRNFTAPRATIAIAGAGGLGIPAAPDATLAAVPAGSDGVNLMPDTFSATAGMANVSTGRTDEARLLRGSDAYSLFSTLEHSMRQGRMGAYAELSWRYADTSTGHVSGVLQPLRLSQTHPLNPFRDDVTPGFTGRVINVSFDPVDLPADSATSHQRTLRTVGGLKGQLEFASARTFNWAIDVSWDRNETYSRNVSYRRNLSAAVNAGFYNPLRDLTSAALISGAELDSFLWESVGRTRLDILATNWRVNGDLFNTRGGEARFSLGLEARSEDARYHQISEAGSHSMLPGAFFVAEVYDESTDRQAVAGYAEVVVPLVGERNQRPLLRELELVAATRLEKYDDFGMASPPMVGLKYRPFRDVILRGSYSEGFQPPTQAALQAPVESYSIIGYGYLDPERNFEEIEGEALYGGNPGLLPETSDTWDAGVVYMPRFIPGLSLTASYFRYDKFDVVANLALEQLLALVPERIVRGPALPGEPAGTPGPVLLIDGTAINLARQFIDGWDFKLDYAHDLGGGRSFGLGGEATRTDRYSIQEVPGAEFIDRTGQSSLFTGTGPLHWRGKASLWFAAGNMSWTWTTRYFDSYVGDTTFATPDNPFGNGLDGARIPSSIEHDLVFNFELPATSGTTGAALLNALQGTRWTIGARNVFDTTPPLVSARYQLWYSGFNDPRERVLYLQVRKGF